MALDTASPVPPSVVRKGTPSSETTSPKWRIARA